MNQKGQTFLELHGLGTKDTINDMSVKNMYQEDMVKAKGNGHRMCTWKDLKLRTMKRSFRTYLRPLH
ncbi:hypothetical protein RRG08_031497 [Elysia crispata]|uniref:Uncharacterized protein n=1 Tax=Elysia crispata TaxID=231223 RepID=A0AAE0YZG7_9GAST|nr:hypothetical protein RRG08_031497 [Elysia crispata]